MTNRDGRRQTSPKVGVALWCMPGGGLEALQLASRYGFDFVQIDFGKRSSGPGLNDRVYLDECKFFAHELGLPVTAVSCNRLNDIGLSAKQGTLQAADAKAAMCQAIEAARSIGSVYVNFPSFRRGLISNTLELVYTADLLKWACHVAEPFGISVANENSLSATQTLELMRLVDSPNFCVLLDTYNPVQFGHNVRNIVEQVFPTIANEIHLKDGVNGVPGSATLGEGEACLQETVSSLARNGSSDFVFENNYLEQTEERILADISAYPALFSECTE